MTNSVSVALLLVASAVQLVVGANIRRMELPLEPLAVDDEHTTNKKNDQPLRDYYRSMLDQLRERGPTLVDALDRQQQQQQQQQNRPQAEASHEQQQIVALEQYPMIASQDGASVQGADSIGVNGAESINSYGDSPVSGPVIGAPAPAPAPQPTTASPSWSGGKSVEQRPTGLESEAQRRLRLTKLARLLKSTSGHLFAPMLYAQALNQQQQQPGSQPIYRADRADNGDRNGENLRGWGPWSSPAADTNGEDSVVIPSSVALVDSGQPRYNIYPLFGGADKKRSAAASDENEARRRSAASKRSQHYSASGQSGQSGMDVEEQGGGGGGEAWPSYLLKSRLPINIKDNNNENQLLQLLQPPGSSKDGDEQPDSMNDLNAIRLAIKSLYEKESGDNFGEEQLKSNDNNKGLAERNNSKSSDYVQRILNDKWNILKHLNFGNNNNKIEALRQQEEKFKRSSSGPTTNNDNNNKRNNKLIFQHKNIGFKQQQQQPSPSHRMDIAQSFLM